MALATGFDAPTVGPIAPEASAQGSGKTNGSSRRFESVAVLLSMHGNVTETSISNLVLLDKKGKLRSPAKRDILQGVSLANVESLAANENLLLVYEDLTIDDFRDAKEILMTGTTGCVWSAVEFDGVEISDGKPGPLCKAIQQAWSKRLDFDFVAQASSECIGKQLS
jgi:branched-subunit amino acid aminotransferase/4-amino-4-deoxychorismate lyase